MLQYIWNLKTFSTWSKADTKGQWLSYHIVWGSQRSLIQRDRKVGFYVQFNKETGLVNLCWGRLYRDQSSCSEQLGEKAMVYILYTQSTHELKEGISPWALCEVGKILPFLHGSEILRSLKWPQKKNGVNSTHSLRTSLTRGFIHIPRLQRNPPSLMLLMPDILSQWQNQTEPHGKLASEKWVVIVPEPNRVVLKPLNLRRIGKT